MKRARSKKILFTAAILVMLATVISVLALNIFAAEEVDAMIDIKEAFDEKYKIGESYPLANDGYIGTNVELTTYYDYKTFGAAKTGYHGTNIALYFVNTKIRNPQNIFCMIPHLIITFYLFFLLYMSQANLLLSLLPAYCC